MDEPVPIRDRFAHVLIALMKGVVWRDDDERRWSHLRAQQNRVSDYVSALGLRLELDESEGYAVLRQRDPIDGEELPRLVPQRPLSYPVSLLLVLLRKRLLEADGGGLDPRVIMGQDEIVAMLRHFLPATMNEARLVDQIGTHINKVKELGFLRPLRGRDGEYEVVRLLKSFVDAQKLEEILGGYRAYASSLAGETAT
jgi:hypothetical protein